MSVSYRARGVGQRAVVFMAVLLTLAMSLAFVPTTARAVDVARQESAAQDGRGAGPLAVGRETGFLQVRDNGELWYYEWTNRWEFKGWYVDSGWQNTKLVALLGRFGYPDFSSRFVEIKGDQLRSWSLVWTGTRYRAVHHEDMGPGWSSTRMIAGVGDIRGDGGFEFIQLRTNGDLILYTSRGTGFIYEDWLDNGYEHARLIAGSQWYWGHYVVVNDLEDLWEFQILTNPDNKPWGRRKMSGWQNVRLLGPGGTSPGGPSDASFVSIRYSGELVQWHRPCELLDCNWQYGYRDTNWGNTRLIG